MRLCLGCFFNRIFIFCVVLALACFQAHSADVQRLPFCDYSFSQLTQKEVKLPSDLASVLKENYRQAKKFTPILATKRFLLVHVDKYERVAVLDRKTFEYLGYIGFSLKKSMGKKRAHLPIYITRKDHGVGTEAKYALMKYAFEKEGVDEINASIDRFNEPSIKLHKKLGFLRVPTQLESRVWDFLINREQFQRLEEERRIEDNSQSFFFPRRILKND